MLGKIYKITNKINGKIYIGQAIKKYGKENFTIELIEQVEKDKLDEREVYWISFYNSYQKGYNCTLGGQNGATRKCSLSLEEENEVIEAKYLGFSSKEIGEVYNIDKSTVCNIFKRHNLKLPNKRSLEDRINKEDFIKFLSTNPTYKQIEDKFNICRCSIYNYIKKHNIEYNSSKSVQTLPSNVEG